MRFSAVLQSYAPRSREASRLLNALTSAFRKHLDEVHPTTAEPSPPASGRKLAPGALSSAVAADRHLASILTNPLIDNIVGSRASKSLESALQTPGADAIAIFEELDAQQRMTFPKATQCLQRFLTALSHLPEDDRLRVIREQSPGLRFLPWFCSDETHFAYSVSLRAHFHRTLVYLLLVEGREALLWERLKLGLPLYDDPDGLPRAPSLALDQSRERRSWRWPVSILHDMIDAKLSTSPRRGLNRHKSLDHGLDACLAAFRLQSESTSVRIPMLMPCWKMVSFLDRGTSLRTAHRLRETFSADLRKYSLWLDLVKNETDLSGSFHWQLVFLRARLNHPNFRDPVTALKLLDSLCDPGSDESGSIAAFNKVAGASFRHRWFSYFTDCAIYLEEDGQIAEASRYFSKIEAYYPERKLELRAITDGRRGDEVRDNEAGDTDTMDMGGILHPGIT